MLDDAQSTVMSILHGAAGDKFAHRQMGLGRFCATYTQPLVNYLIRAKRLTEEDAADTVQDFWLTKMLRPSPEENLVAKYLLACKAYDKSSFRSYLSVALNNFLRSKYRNASESKRRSQVSVEQLNGWEVESPGDLDQFDAAWANHILVIVLNKVREECSASRLCMKWAIFTKLILQPVASNQPRPSYAELASELGVQNTKEIGNSLITFRRIFMRHLEIAVQDYLPANSSEESVASAQCEVAIILAKLSRAGGLQLPLAEWGVAAMETNAEYSLVLSNLTAANLLKNDTDYHAAWQCILSTHVSEVIDMAESNHRQLTVEEVIAGEAEDVEMLNRIRSAAKQLGSMQARDSTIATHLNRKIYGLIYLIAIAAAKLGFDKDISSQPGLQLESLAKSFICENWIDKKTRLLLEQYQMRINDAST